MSTTSGLDGQAFFDQAAHVFEGVYLGHSLIVAQAKDAREAEGVAALVPCLFDLPCCLSPFTLTNVRYLTLEKTCAEHTVFNAGRINGVMPRREVDDLSHPVERQFFVQIIFHKAENFFYPGIHFATSQRWVKVVAKATPLNFFTWNCKPPNA